MLIDPVLKMFWILIAAILASNAVWMIYIGGTEEEIDVLYKLLKGQPLSMSDKKRLDKISRRRKRK
ncbi:MAG: hypothetical protein LBR79_02905 [Oscillospiraceae bacterium]|jgi:hypothetical protein|nr:hypothetical protein [Oscillospiraceae bacterium]